MEIDDSRSLNVTDNNFGAAVAIQICGNHEINTIQISNFKFLFLYYASSLSDAWGIGIYPRQQSLRGCLALGHFTCAKPPRILFAPGADSIAQQLLLTA
jgi:hypothetical protein